MNNTIFNFKYETVPVEEVVVEPSKELPSGLVDAFDSKIACFTNKVPLDELSSGLLSRAKDAAYAKGEDTFNDEEKVKRFNQGNKFRNRKRFAPEKVTEGITDPQDFTVHLRNIGGGDKHGEVSKFTKNARSVKSVVQNLSDFADQSNGASRQVATHVTDSNGKVVWKNESVEDIQELSIATLDSYGKKIKDTKPKNVRDAVNKYLSARSAAEKTKEKTAVVKAQSAGYHTESAETIQEFAVEVKSDKIKSALKTASSISMSANAGEAASAKAKGNDQQAKSLGAKVVKAGKVYNLVKNPNFTEANKEMEIAKNPLVKVTGDPIEKPDSSKEKTEKSASADHGPNINQEPMHKYSKKGVAMESVRCKFSDLIEIFSLDHEVSSLSEIWDIEIFKEDSKVKYIIKDGDDILAEGVNLTTNSAAKNAVRKCIMLESEVMHKVEQPSRVMSVIKSITK